jgi:hypothetical protein
VLEVLESLGRRTNGYRLAFRIRRVLRANPGLDVLGHEEVCSVIDTWMRSFTERLLVTQ